MGATSRCLGHVEQTTAERGGDRFGTIRGTHSREESGEKDVNLLLADTETAGDFRCRFSVRQQLKRQTFARCNPQHRSLSFSARDRPSNCAGGRSAVIDGPFTETKELIGG